MKSEIVIRQMETGEETSICTLVMECFNEFVAPGYSCEGVGEFTKYVQPLSMKERMLAGNIILVAKVGAEAAGIVEIRQPNHISLLFVKKEFHRMGIGRKLMDRAVEKCIELYPQIDYMEVNSSPYAVEIYERMGFAREDVEQTVNGIRFIPMNLGLKNEIRIAESERLILRLIRKADFNVMKNIWGNDNVMKYCLGSINDENIHRAIDCYIKNHNLKGFGIYAIVNRENNLFMGVCGFNTSEKEDEIELLYHLAEDFWGQGYAFEAAALCIDYIRKNCKGRINRITASAYSENTSSLKILKNLGFQYIEDRWFEDIGQYEPCFEMNL